MHRTIFLLKWLERYPVFDLQKFTTTIKKPSTYAKVALHRLVKSGLIYRLEKNKYTVYKDALRIATHITWPSYISFWSALRWHNLTEQLPQDVWVATSRRRKHSDLIINSTKIHFIKINKKYLFGFIKVLYEGTEIFMAEPEKAIIDSILYRKVSLTEIYDIFRSNRPRVSRSKLLRYAKMTGNKKIIEQIKALK